ncbi:hypothetical protein DSECCO2_649800 [anaerobic digester metagenome]
MITLDSIKIHAPTDIIRSQNTDLFRFEQGGIECSGQVQKDKLIANGNISGLKRIEIDRIKNTVQLELSAKILGDDYYKLISLDTIEQVFDTVNMSGLIEVDTGKLDQFNVHSLDCTKNLKGKHRPQTYLDNLMLLPQNTKYSRATYRGTGDNRYKTGIVFTGRQRTFKERLLAYDKHEELRHDKRFIQSVNQGLTLLNQFSNVTRVECAFTNYSRIREFFNVPDQNLLRILSSKEQPAYKVYKRIKGNGNVQLELFNYPDTMRWNELVSYYGLRQICIDCNGDLSLIADLIRKHVGQNTGISYQLKQVKKVMSQIGDIDTGQQTDNEVIAEFEYLLKTA